MLFEYVFDQTGWEPVAESGKMPDFQASLIEAWARNRTLA
jgi:hypothetical protein